MLKLFKNNVGRPTNEVLKTRRIIKMIILASFILVVLIMANLLKLKKEAIKYTVLFNSNGGSNVEKQIVEEGSLAVEPINPEKENYFFLGWYINDVLYDFSSPVNKNLTLIANWEEKKEDTILISFDSTGGTNIESQIIKKGEKIAIPSIPTKEDSEFLGWYLGEEKFDFNQTVNEDTKLEAKWEIIVTKTKDKTTAVSNKQKTTAKTNVTTENKTTTTTKSVTTTSKQIKISPVNGLKVEYWSNGNIKFNYNSYQPVDGAVNSIDGYEVFRSESQNGNYVSVSTSAMTYAYADGIIDTSKGYYYRVKAYKFNSGVKQYSEFGNYVYVPARVSSPGNVFLTGNYNSYNTIGTMKLTYDTTGADEYILYTGSQDNSSSYTEQQRSTRGSMTSSWKAESNYYKIVAKKTGDNYVMYSYPNKGYYIPNLGPISLTATGKNVSNGNNTFTYYVTFNWNSVPNADRYEITTTSNYYCENSPYMYVDKSLTTYTAVGSNYAKISARKIGPYYNLQSYSDCITVTKIN